ncbi:MAG: 4Fe-4S dicluster domain-containing protein [Spirochaetales bacterium]|nr:4Fe-4S dicluster domain-containing protein [Spirochaetales bacterium]
MAIGFVIDAEKCTECERCMAACSLVKTGRVALRQSRIRILRRWPATPGFEVCRFDDCAGLSDNPGQPCIDACPAAAIANHNGIVLIDREACTACGACVEACPFGAILQDSDGLAWKCDFCGGTPACVPECVTGALTVKEA